MNIRDVENLAELAKIELSEEEKGAVLKDMEGILAYVQVIEKVEVPEVAPVYNQKNIWREDEAQTAVFSKDLILQQFPEAQPARPHDSSGAGGDGIFLKVKKIL
jgi:aspartyl-tRNA(Asn)/glutamyl-tRNA(Gln) amidotransferase subunit C